MTYESWGDHVKFWSKRIKKRTLAPLRAKDTGCQFQALGEGEPNDRNNKEPAITSAVTAGSWGSVLEMQEYEVAGRRQNELIVPLED